MVARKNEWIGRDKETDSGELTHLSGDQYGHGVEIKGSSTPESGFK